MSKDIGALFANDLLVAAHRLGEQFDEPETDVYLAQCEADFIKAVHDAFLTYGWTPPRTSHHFIRRD